MSLPLPDFFRDLFQGNQTPTQKACSHVLSSRMSDGKYFCPSCRLVSSFPLTKPTPSKGTP